jgi:glyoxylase-like metal-dependent hydrolase (beta-lactamase superfamily II)
MARSPAIRAFFDEATNTVSYLVADPSTGDSAAIDPVLDFDPASGAVGTRSAEAMLAAAVQEGWTVRAVLETHAHADHLSAAQFIKAKTGAWIGIGEQIRAVQAIFAPLFGAADVAGDAADFDRLFADSERFRIGALEVEVLYVPGHTPADVAYRIGDSVFAGDTLFMPDYGTARTDFPGGDARQLYRSIQRLLSLPPDTTLFMCHDYKAPGRDRFAWETTVGEQRERNVHVRQGVSEEDFVAMRQARDSTLAVPKLLYPSVQVNIRAGRLPPADPNGRRYLKIPLTVVAR